MVKFCSLVQLVLLHGETIHNAGPGHRANEILFFSLWGIKSIHFRLVYFLAPTGLRRFYNFVYIFICISNRSNCIGNCLYVNGQLYLVLCFFQSLSNSKVLNGEYKTLLIKSVYMLGMYSVHYKPSINSRGKKIIQIRRTTDYRADMSALFVCCIG